MPAAVDLPANAVSDCRLRLESFLRAQYPELDLSPNTVLGDLVLTPQAFQIAAIEEGMGRFMSDLDLENVANDIIYNCDFVTQYLKNFSIDSSAELRSSGVVRLAFSENKQYILDRSTLFQFGEFIFRIYLPNKGKFFINKVGVAPDEGTNGTSLKDAGNGAYYADVPVVGTTDSVTVTSGTGGAISDPISELGAITALVDFTSGVDTQSQPVLAERTRKTVYSATLNTRNGVIKYMDSICPFVDSAYAIRTGDREMKRSFNSGAGTFGFPCACMDVYVRSKQYAFEEIQTLKFIKVPGDAGSNTFEAVFDYVGQPYYITSITHEMLPEFSDIQRTIIAEELPIGSRNYDSSHSGDLTHWTNKLGIISAYSRYEKLTIRIDGNKYTDENGALLFPTYVDEEGNICADFVIQYSTDPLLQAIAETVENPDYAPVNVSMLVRGFIPVIIKRFNVVYTKKPGVVPLLSEARDRIKSYMDGLGAPYAYSDAEISRIMQEAGVKYVKKINVTANVQWSLADKFKVVNQSTGETEEVSVKNNTIIGVSDGLRVSYDGSDGYGNMYACSIRNIRYYLMEGAVTFTEEREM